MTPGYMVYWTDNVYGAKSQYFREDEMLKALDFVNNLRKDVDAQFITYVSQNPNSIGKAGVDSVVDGKLPDGSDYTWMKRRNQ